MRFSAVGLLIKHLGVRNVKQDTIFNPCQRDIHRTTSLGSVLLHHNPSFVLNKELQTNIRQKTNTGVFNGTRGRFPFLRWLRCNFRILVQILDHFLPGMLVGFEISTFRRRNAGLATEDGTRGVYRELIRQLSTRHTSRVDLTM